MTTPTLPALSCAEPTYLSSGPWGRVECVPILLSPPRSFASCFHAAQQNQPWLFPGYDLADTDKLLAGMGMQPAERQSLLASTRWNASAGALEVDTDGSVVADLPLDVRERVYDWLSLHEANPAHANAFRFLSKSLDEWFHAAPIQDSTIELIKRYAYRRGPYWVFADLPLLAQELEAEELTLALKVLSRESTLMLKLHVSGSESVDELARYWGLAGRNKDVLPLLESLTHFRHEQSVDMVHLLPPFARRYLFTYPRPMQDGRDHRRDCHWTTMNFFRETPDDQFTNLDVVAQSVQQNMRTVSAAELKFGDVAMFFANDCEAIHSAVYIAGDIVFTKNGPGLTRPWMLMRLEDLRHFYTQGRPQTVKYYRWHDLE